MSWVLGYRLASVYFGDTGGRGGSLVVAVLEIGPERAAERYENFEACEMRRKIGKRRRDKLKMHMERREETTVVKGGEDRACQEEE